ncbi:isoprenylcysteine carboxylmethyltransferase family protein [Aurantimonas sp. Leaf443]|uniref:methyltransferase family protein n=1 Tax=Aurantimonas sp. Leaf443 TaxID=1736378 RepID=UPI0006F4793B|nr:isoprenylcysteine carboxylmethyltransferase family protein [Aurantimonas sp. Leaf443]KQT88326.1 protein-S-isoprenylcysteine methyltransferase [Aurantimonas sp. Leaf443]
MSIRRDFPDLPPVWAAGATLASIALGRFLPIVALPRWMDGAGAGSVLCGIALAAWAALWFRRKRTPIEPREAPRALIVEGPFRVNRNPIYTGMILVALGAALWSGGLSGLLPALALPFVLTKRFVRGEEVALRQAFGREADLYFAATRRW